MIDVFDKMPSHMHIYIYIYDIYECVCVCSIKVMLLNYSVYIRWIATRVLFVPTATF